MSEQAPVVPKVQIFDLGPKRALSSDLQQRMWGDAAAHYEDSMPKFNDIDFDFRGTHREYHGNMILVLHNLPVSLSEITLNGSTYPRIRAGSSPRDLRPC